MKSAESGKICIVVGTYEKTLHGYELEVGKQNAQLNRIFAFATNHLGCIKTVCLDPTSKWLISGSTDENIRLMVIDASNKQECTTWQSAKKLEVLCITREWCLALTFLALLTSLLEEKKGLWLFGGEKAQSGSW